MTQVNSDIQQSGKVLPLEFNPTEFAEFGKKRMEGFVHAQAELLQEIQETNREWFDRLQSEAEQTSKLAEKLKSVNSMPDAVRVYQEWAARWFEMVAEDGRHLVADYQKFMQAGARLMTNGWLDG